MEHVSIYPYIRMHVACTLLITIFCNGMAPSSSPGNLEDNLSQQERDLADCTMLTTLACYSTSLCASSLFASPLITKLCCLTGCASCCCRAGIGCVTLFEKMSKAPQAAVSMPASTQAPPKKAPLLEFNV